MGGKKSSSRKRPLAEVENKDPAPASKRHEIEPKSPKTAIRDASEALIEAIKKAEEVQLHLAAKDGLRRAPTKGPKRAPKQTIKPDPDVNFNFEKDEPTGLPFVYIVMEKNVSNYTDID